MSRQRATWNDQHASTGKKHLPKNSTPLYLRLALVAISLVPLQQAFTINIGSPLKPSELLMAGSIVLWLFSSRKKKSPAEFKLIIALLAILLLSALFHLAARTPLGDFLGYSRSPDGDLIFYTIYPIFVLFMWRVASEVPHEMFQKAIKLSIWVCFAGVAFQLAMMQMDRVDILELFSYETKIRSESLTGSGEGAMRNGTFTEGQHLGFFSAISVLVAWRCRAYLTLSVALFTLAYSQSTTGIVGLVLVVFLLVLMRPSTRAAIKIGMGLAASVITVLLVDSLRNLIILQAAKLGLAAGSHQIEGATASIEVRSLKTEIAWRMMWDNPILGVGPGRFGFWYFKDPASIDSPFWYFLPDRRTIAENAYMQIGSELGVIALLVFIAFMWSLLKRVRRNDKTLLGVFFLIALGIASQSSWTFIPIWIFSAFIISGTYESDPDVDPALVGINQGMIADPRKPNSVD
ncbi:O-antigen ligase family protein [Glutamicibacter mishrai]|uniref:O-antigen ligase domain-containing protein n=1 Tax=Glutamicibacter mishrai TaxID=1775880 RepID=A0A6H0SH12_9MICC|nr:O-antigen ligase family protein [Glutamicibacter mishrai]QIV86460.1 O-antigen ligase domain-containing protein [Glutamicibacter mishrai]